MSVAQHVLGLPPSTRNPHLWYSPATMPAVAKAVARALARLDPAHAPGTGTPEAGGMTSRELLHCLRNLVGVNVVGADIVEVAPAYDHAEITGIAAAHVAYELLSVLAASA